MPRAKADLPLKFLDDVIAGLGLLTRIPVPFRPLRPQAAWAWPLIGVIVAGGAVGIGYAALQLGLGVGSVAVLMLGAQAILTGALHEDGLADCADGFFGGHDKQRRLAIMKDSQIGSFGALALCLCVLARWSALVALIHGGQWGVVLAAGAISRAPMAALMAGLPNARGSGLSATVGAPSHQTAVIACGLALILGLILCGWSAIALVAAVAAVTLGLGMVAKAKIGGQTGDVLGAGQQLSEVVILIVAA
jgi:adenosylcobinamide-GDP ribazoletransferase